MRKNFGFSIKEVADMIKSYLAFISLLKMLIKCQKFLNCKRKWKMFEFRKYFKFYLHKGINNGSSFTILFFAFNIVAFDKYLKILYGADNLTK